MKKWLRIVLLGLLGVFVLVQFIPVDRSTPEMMPGQDFLTVVNAPAEMATLIKDACYDCHSYQTEYPWYSKVAPVSFWIQQHINEGREHLNFAIWSTYPAERAAHKLEECWEEVEEGHMPLPSFTWLHPEGRLSEGQQSALAQWFQQQYRASSLSNRQDEPANEAAESHEGHDHN
jgi:hypothetical protein